VGGLKPPHPHKEEKANSPKNANQRQLVQSAQPTSNLQHQQKRKHNPKNKPFLMVVNN
jgi:hypothetical protein